MSEVISQHGWKGEKNKFIKQGGEAGRKDGNNLPFYQLSSPGKREREWILHPSSVSLNLPGPCFSYNVFTF